VAAAGRLAILELVGMAGWVAGPLAEMGLRGLVAAVAVVAAHMLLLLGGLSVVVVAGLDCLGLALRGLVG
jgi:hypothetical protein